MHTTTGWYENGIFRGIEARRLNTPLLGGVLMEPLFAWAESLPGVNGLTLSVWGDTLPEWILLSQRKLTQADAESLSRLTEWHLHHVYGWVVRLSAHLSFRHGEERLVMWDEESRTASYDFMTST